MVDGAPRLARRQADPTQQEVVGRWAGTRPRPPRAWPKRCRRQGKPQPVGRQWTGGSRAQPQRDMDLGPNPGALHLQSITDIGRPTVCAYGDIYFVASIIGRGRQNRIVERTTTGGAPPPDLGFLILEEQHLLQTGARITSDRPELHRGGCVSTSAGLRGAYPPRSTA